MSTTESVAWTPFWWESNSCWGEVCSQEEWDAMVTKFSAQRNIDRERAREEMLSKGAVATWDHPATLVDAGHLPSIGLRREHVGGKAFKSWLAEHGMLEACQRPLTLLGRIKARFLPR